MESVRSGRNAATEADRRLRAFRATDAFVIEAFRVSLSLAGDVGRELGRELRGVLARSGATLVAAATDIDAAGAGNLAGARTALAEARYYLFLARRLGLLDLRRYRVLVAAQDGAQRELEAAGVEKGPAASPRCRSPG